MPESILQRCQKVSTEPPNEITGAKAGMNEAKRQIAGLWWMPTNPQEKWVGLLTLEYDKGPLLVLTVPKGHDFTPPKIGEIIHGCDQHGKPVTLLNPAENESSSSTALTFIKYSAGAVILGLELPTRNAFLVNCIEINLQHFYEWAGITGFVTKPGSTTNEVSIAHSLPELRSFQIDHDLTVEIGTSFVFHNGSKEKSLTEDTFVQFKSRKGLGFSECKTLVHAMRSLLHFGVLSPVYPLRIECKKIGFGQTLGETYIPNKIEIWWSLNRKSVSSEHRDRWVFRFSDVEKDFGQFMRNWLAFLKKFDEALGCYFTTVYHALTSPVQNICLAQALEAFHATKHPSKGKVFFNDRVRSLVKNQWVPLKEFVKDPETFSKQVTDNRNHFTHHGSKSAQRALSGANLIRLNERMQLLFQMCILTEMGIPAARFPRLRRQLAQHIIEYS